jgi:small subunit ribosomal protein S1
VGETVKAEIITIEGSKIFLSMRRLIKDPWADVNEKYKVGEKVKGTVLKVNPFGLFVELDDDIHGLAHISELSDKPVKDVSEIAKSGDELEFTIISIEPEQHRLGLSLKKGTKTKKEDNKEEKKEEKEDKQPVNEKATEVKEEKTEK